MKRLLALILLLCCPLLQAAEIRHLVLVTATPALAQAEFNRKEIRKLFLGRTLVRGKQRIVPIINESDPLAYQIFLQRIMLISSSSYERFLLSRVFRKGGIRPEKTASTRQLLYALRSRPGTVTYMWQSQMRADPEIRIIRELWRGELQ